MAYEIIMSPEAQKGLVKLQRSEPNSVKKFTNLLKELREHPRTGTGKVEILKYYKGKEFWSRRINRKHRIIYTIEDDVIRVLIISVYGHYE